MPQFLTPIMAQDESTPGTPTTPSERASLSSRLQEAQQELDELGYVVEYSPTAWKEEKQQLQQDLSKPLDFWLQEIASDDTNRRERAAEVLQSAANLIWQLDLSRLPSSDSIIYGEPALPDDPEFEEKFAGLAARWQQEVRAALPILIDVLNQRIRQRDETEVSTLDYSLACCITVSTPDGKGLIRLRQKIGRSPATAEFLYFFLQYTAATLPADQALHVILVPELRNLSADTRSALDEAWNGLPQKDGEPESVASLSIGMYAMAILWPMFARDRLQLEMPLLIEALRPEYPQLIRCTSLACFLSLTEFGAPYECEPALPHLRDLLNDDCRLIWNYAAAAIVLTEGDRFELDTLLNTAKLSDVRREELRDYVEQLLKAYSERQGSRIRFDGDDAEPNSGLDENVVREIDEQQEHMLREQLNRIHRIEIRSALHQIANMGPAGRRFESQIRPHLEASEPLTRTMAQRALAAIRDTKKPADVE